MENSRSDFFSDTNAEETSAPKPAGPAPQGGAQTGRGGRETNRLMCSVIIKKPLAFIYSLRREREKKEREMEERIEMR